MGCSSRPPSLETPGRAHGGPPQPCRLVCSQADDATSRAQDSPGASMPPPLKLNAQELPSRHRSSRSVSYTARVGPWLGRTSGAPPLGPAARPDERRRRKPRPGPHRRGGPLAAPAMRGARTTRPRATSPCNLSKSSDGLARRAASPLSRSNSCIPGPGIPARPRRTSRLLALLSSMANDPQPWDGGSMRGQACREARGAAHGRQHWEPPTNPALGRRRQALRAVLPLAGKAVELRDTQPWDASARCRARHASRPAARASSGTPSLKSWLEEKVEAQLAADGTVVIAASQPWGARPRRRSRRTSRPAALSSARTPSPGMPARGDGRHTAAAASFEALRSSSGTTCWPQAHVAACRGTMTTGEGTTARPCRLQGRDAGSRWRQAPPSRSRSSRASEQQSCCWPGLRDRTQTRTCEGQRRCRASCVRPQHRRYVPREIKTMIGHHVCALKSRRHCGTTPMRVAQCGTGELLQQGAALCMGVLLHEGSTHRTCALVRVRQLGSLTHCTLVQASGTSAAGRA